MSVATVSKCRVCGREFKPASTGRPPAFCSGLCRRRSEFALRRVDRLAAEVDRLTVHLEESRAGVNPYGGTRNRSAELERQIAFRRARAREIADSVNLGEVFV